MSHIVPPQGTVIQFLEVDIQYTTPEYRLDWQQSSKSIRRAPAPQQKSFEKFAYFFYPPLPSKLRHFKAFF